MYKTRQTYLRWSEAQGKKPVRHHGPLALWTRGMLGRDDVFSSLLGYPGVNSAFKRWFEAINGNSYHLLSHIFRTESAKYNKAQDVQKV